MTAHTLRYAIATALLASLALAGCKKQTPETTSPPMSTPAPATQTAPPVMNSTIAVTTVTLGTATGADKSITAATSQFSAKDPIVVSVATSGMSTDANIHTRLMFEDGQVAGDESQSIAATGMDTTNFTFNNANGWPTGSYTAEVSVNGAPPHSTSFTVK